MKLLCLVPAVLCCVSVYCSAVTEFLSLPAPLRPVCQTVAETLPEKENQDRVGFGDRLEGLRKQLGGLAEDLTQTHRAVDEMARQRDVAQEQARQSQEARRLAMEEAVALRKQLAEARQAGKQWQAKAGKLEEQMKEGALAHADLQKFRSELQGAMREFQELKGDFGKARQELQDPMERAALKKSVAKLEDERARLGDEIKVALRAKADEVAQSARMRKELEGKLKTVLGQYQDAKKKADGIASIEAAKQAAMAKATELGVQMQASRKAQDTLKAELARAMTTIKVMGAAAEKPRQALERSEVSRRKAMEQVRDANTVSAKVREELKVLKLAKTGLEELLFKKTDELRGLRKKVQELEALAQKEEASSPQDQEATAVRNRGQE